MNALIIGNSAGHNANEELTASTKPAMMKMSPIHWGLHVNR
jgi:hypothetical protein